MGEWLEALRGKLRKVWPYLAAIVFLLVAGAALIFLPERAVPKEAYWLDTKTIFDIKNEARRTIAYLIGSLLAVIGIILTFHRIRALERQVQTGQEQLKVAQDQLQVAQEGQITERFTRAIEQLGSDKVAIRFGGIYALERIAKDSDKDYWPIMETLTAVVRAAPLREPPVASLYMDVQAILTVLARRKYHFGQGENQPLDLRGTDLRGADLREAHLEEAWLMGAHLEGASLVGATGLTRQQLDEAILDEKTILPEYLHNQPPEAERPEGNDEE